jgi:isocitrate dehydrogenase kinase/phosphatase
MPAELWEGALLARSIAETILVGFDKHFRIFRDISRQARQLFIESDWAAGRAATRERINLYDTRVAEAIEALKARFAIAELDPTLWQEVKLQYMGLLYEHRQPELAETFYNSVFCRVFDRQYYNNRHIFVRPGLSTAYLEGDRPVYRSYYPTHRGWRATLEEILRSADVGLPFENLRRDLRNIVHLLRHHPGLPVGELRQHFQLQVLTPVFFRNKAAYIVGRAVNGPDRFPFIIPLLDNGRGAVYVDALIIDQDDVANLFSFARAYFMVACDVASALVRFLLSILPSKSAADLYTAIGFHKQGKAEFYRDFLHHLGHSTDQLIVAPGIKGMVMTVFTLPSYPYVFKVIKERFRPPKETTRENVKAKYTMVKQHDRVGRMADTWEFSHAAFPLERFSDELLAELQREVPSLLAIEGDQVIIRHLYIERRLVPLNLYLETADGPSMRHALQEYGDAIKQMAAAGIFPGDLLFKNFGVTGHQRVIFYDYDEIVPMEEINFRHIPPPRFPEDEMASEPWYSVGPDDVFPEEFRTFLFSGPVQRRVFVELHPELLEADYWKSLQQTIREGGFPDVFPYAPEKRFGRPDREQAP